MASGQRPACTARRTSISRSHEVVFMSFDITKNRRSLNGIARRYILLPHPRLRSAKQRGELAPRAEKRQADATRLHAEHPGNLLVV